MKSIIKSIFLFCVFAVSFTSCETYSDPKVDYSPIYPLSGEWRVRITNVTTGVMVSTTSMYTLGTYNTSDNVANKMWMRFTSSIPTFTPATSIPRTVMAKITCDVPGLSFSTSGVTQNLNVATSSTWPSYALNAVIDTITVTEAKITLNSVVMKSGVMSDRIAFKLAKTKSAGNVYFVEGYRRTRWAEDETVIDFK